MDTHADYLITAISELSEEYHGINNRIILSGDFNGKKMYNIFKLNMPSLKNLLGLDKNTFCPPNNNIAADNIYYTEAFSHVNHARPANKFKKVSDDQHHACCSDPNLPNGYMIKVPLAKKKQLNL